MHLFNLIIVLDKNEEKVLMCYRSKDPYIGKYNLVGGKIEEGEDYLESAYRELYEETGIDKARISLRHFMNFEWLPIDMKMMVYIGKLSEEVELKEEIHKLFWFSLDENFYDLDRFAGEGNIGHMIEIYKIHRNKIIKD
ncbi:MAG: NUDIX hydrolase [Candidatus Izemoplasmatales bacterium]|nr:NUDIX hydrolase [Candidatus Izemoplasmatales bacterium]MDY0138981.1 NUDIX hydrolase [Candidatus Izemoplasmatales bacterium]